MVQTEPAAEAVGGAHTQVGEQQYDATIDPVRLSNHAAKHNLSRESRHPMPAF